MRTAIFPGSFNPFTIGHADICRRALQIFDRLVIMVGYNIHKSDGEFTALERARAIAELYDTDPRVEVKVWGGLTVEAARQTGACAIVRGVRSAIDYEYERQLADTNRHLAGIETVLLVAAPELSFITSSMVRELAAHGQDISKYLPK